MLLGARNGGLGGIEHSEVHDASAHGTVLTATTPGREALRR
jgi:hypothetical protein